MSLPTPPAAAVGRAALGLVACAAIVAVAMAPERIAATGYLAIASGSVLWLALRHRRTGEHGRPWRSVALGLALWVVADLLWYWDMVATAGGGPSAGPADLVYLGGYAALAHGLWRCAPARGGDDERLGVALDVAVVAGVAGVLLVEFVLVPSFTELTLAGWQRWSLGAYPILDVALLTIALRTAFSRDRAHGSALALLALTATLIADLTYVGLLAETVYAEPWWLDALWLGTFALLAAAGTRATGPAAVTPHPPSVMGRLAVLSVVVAVVAPVTLHFAPPPSDWTAFTTAVSVVLPALMMARVVQAVRAERRSQQAAQRSRDRMASVLELSWDLVTIHGPDGRILRASPAAERVLGRTPDDVVGLDPVALAHPDDADRVRDGLAAVYADGGPLTTEYRTRRADGSWMTAESIGVRAVDEDGAPVVVITTRDISERRRAADELRLQAQLLEAVGEAVIATDHDGVIRYWNPAAETMLGWSAEEMLGRRGREAAVEGDGPTARARAEEVARAVAEGGIWSDVFTLRRRDGSTFPALISGRPYLGADGRQEGVISACVDISDLKAVEHQLERRAAQQAAVARLGTQVLSAASIEEVGRLAASTIEDTLETARVRASYVPPGVAIQPDGSQPAVALPLGGPDAPHGRLRILSDRALPDSAHDFLDSVGNVVAAAADQHAVRRELDHLALHHPVTGLPNRALFLDRIEHLRASLARERSRFAVLCLDLDGFKHVNDALGHSAGDRLLVEIAERLRTAVRPEDTVAHFGGDEFGILCQRVGSDDEAAALASRIRDALSPAFELSGSEVVVTTSIGTALGSAGSDGHELLQQADGALYRAKDNGGDQVEHFDAALQHRARRRLDLASGLRAAIDRREIAVHYQPLVDLRSGRIVGAEALARWGSGPAAISPGEFIPVAEATGLIVPLGRMVLEQACEDAQAWDQATDGGFLLSVNASPRELLHGGLDTSVPEVLARTGLPPTHLTLEVTESAFIGDPEVARAALQRLRDLGVHLAIDDFGTGYSSLTYLRNLPFDVIKIDRSFTKGVSTDPHDLAIVSSSVELAQQFGLTSVAEGVETAEQLEVVSTLGGDLGQGFLWSPAVPAEELTAMLSRWQTDPTWPRARPGAS